VSDPEIHPLDGANRKLIDNVHPADWKNPVPTGRYNLVVVGGGSAGLITSALAAGLGARVALVERDRLGGDCLNVGCVPSKAVIRASRMVAEARRAAAELGLALPDEADLDFGAVMERMRNIRARISEEDSALRYRDELGVDVYLGQACFDSPNSVMVDDVRLAFRKAVIATGARASAPPIPGLEEAGYRTNETIFELTERPKRLGVIGAGPIGCELGQAFARLGSQVTVFDAADQVLSREDPDAAEIVGRHLAADGAELVLGCAIEKVEVSGNAKRVCGTKSNGEAATVEVDEILLAVGRAPNLEGLNLDAAGVESDPRQGVRVNDYLQTSNPHIYAAGDICMKWKFTHAADAAAKIVVQNALFLRTKKLSSLVMPWCTYTDPEVAHVGLGRRDAEEQGIPIDTYEATMTEVNRAVTDGEDDGFVRIHVKRGRDEIVGATIVAAHAGEMISEVTVAIVGKLGLGTLLNTIHPYPTQAEGIKRVAGIHARSRVTPTLQKILSTWMRFRR
jgi:pyruvate/2-oxoglutarate dehydrogenase complex dihydrolipoamide dehydrogenase (E3) component